MSKKKVKPPEQFFDPGDMLIQFFLDKTSIALFAKNLSNDRLVLLNDCKKLHIAQDKMKKPYKKMSYEDGYFIQHCFDKPYKENNNEE